jgi:hypothetical protein
VPVTAAIAVLVRFAIEVYLMSPIYRGHEAQPSVGIRERERERA